MKIYFTAAISQVEEFGTYYTRIIKALEQNSTNSVQYDHVTETSFTQIKDQNHDAFVEFYKKAVRWITQSDIVVVEASFPSTLNIGHEITLALEKGKPVIMFYKKGFETFFLSGLNSEKLFLIEYNDNNLEQLVKDTLDYAKDQSDTRFNFFISPSLSHYLDWISQHKKIPRSVYLRQLIENDREKNKEYFEA